MLIESLAQLNNNLININKVQNTNGEVVCTDFTAVWEYKVPRDGIMTCSMSSTTSTYSQGALYINSVPRLRINNGESTVSNVVFGSYVVRQNDVVRFVPWSTFYLKSLSIAMY